VITSEELRVTALAASANRGKWVARRRIYWRWTSWIAWRYVLPVVGLLVLTATLIGLAFWQYFGHDAAYIAAQKWVQQEFGNFQMNTNNNTDAAHLSPPSNSSQKIASPYQTSIPQSTDTMTLRLQIDRRLDLKMNP
jgi:hypothetical protein